MGKGIERFKILDTNKLMLGGVAVASTAAEIDAGSGAAVGVVADDLTKLTAITASAAEINKLTGVTAGTAAASKALVLGANKNVDVIVVAASGLYIGSGAGTAMTATAAELNVLASVTAGTTSASKALVVDVNKALDTLSLPVSGLKIGAGGGSAVTPTAAEINVLAAVVAGTSSASKAAVLGANKNLDVLALPVGGLAIGVGAGTAITPTAAEINTLASSGITNADLVKVHAITASAAEVSTLASSAVTNADLVKLHAVTAAAATLNQVAAAAGTVTFDRSVKVARVALTALDTGGGVFSWVNPEAGSIIVDRVVLDVTTKSTAACTIDVGTTATNATTSSDTLIDGLDIGTSAGVFDNLQNPGSNGKPLQKLATGKWVTASMDTGAAAGTVGFAYIFYHLI